MASSSRVFANRDTMEGSLKPKTLVDTWFGMELSLLALPLLQIFANRKEAEKLGEGHLPRKPTTLIR